MSHGIAVWHMAALITAGAVYNVVPNLGLIPQM